MNQKKTHRPFGVTLLIAVVLIFTSLNIVRTIAAIQRQSFLHTLDLQVPVSYLAITGAVWGSLGLVLLVGLAARKRWALPLAMILVLGYPLYYWIDRLFIAEWAAFNSRWQFALGLTGLLVIPAVWILKQAGTRRYLSK